MGLPICVVRTPDEWLAHEQGALLACQPVIGLERIGDAPARDFGRPSGRSTASVSCRSPTRWPARRSEGPWPSRGQMCSAPPAPTTTSTSTSTPRPTSAPGAPMSTSTARPGGTGRRASWPRPMWWSTTIGWARSNAGGSIPGSWPIDIPGLVYVSVNCYGHSGPWARRGGFDMNGSAASGLMTIEGTAGRAPLPRHLPHQRLHHRLHGGRRRHGRPGQAGHRRWLLARHRQLDQNGDVVRIARSRRPRHSPGQTTSTACASPPPTTHPALWATSTCWPRPSTSRTHHRRGPTPSSSPRGSSRPEWRT